MREEIQDSITRLLRFQRAPEKITKKFRHLKHNADILPKLQKQLEMVLDACGKFEPIVYDCQGINDDGSDIAVRFNPQGINPELICFQVKSFRDLEKASYMQELKAQRDDSFRKVGGLHSYFIVLCTDGAQHKNRIRNIMAEFRSGERTTVIEPAYAYTFLNLPQTRIEAFVTRLMEAEDYVFRTALESLDVSSLSAKALAVFITVKSILTGQRRFVVDQLLQEPTLRSTYGELRERQATLLEESLARDMQPPEEAFVTLRAEDQEQYEDASDWDDDYGEEQIQLGDFEDQIATDLELLEGAGPRILYANYLTAMGRFEESIAFGKETLRIDPLSPAAYNELGWALEYAGRDEEALEQYRKGLELDPDFPQSHWVLASFDLKKGRMEKAVAECEKTIRALARRPPSWLGEGGYLCGMAGRRAEALRILNELKKRAEKEYVPASALAEIYLGLGKTEQTLQLLEQAYADHDIILVWLKVHWVYDPLRSDPRFQSLLRRMNFPE